ncbi:TetR/AcrR family transcriptional regulator [Anaerolineales bacterium HSG24]|nr:TetR/AcrR family transcriptional regulator [Anaerolineales bacterium HSG24]
MNTKQQILKVALELFIQHGYERTSLTDVAERIGITKPAIYYHYKSKEQLYVAVLNQFLDYFEEYFLHFAQNPASTKETVQQMFNSLAETHNIMSTVSGQSVDYDTEVSYYTLMLEGINTCPEMRPRMAEVSTRMINLMSSIVKQGQEAGEVRADVDPDAFAFQLYATIEGAYMVSVFNRNIDLKSLITPMSDNTWRGIQA